MDDNESMAMEELGNLGKIKCELKSNGVCHVEDVNGRLLEDKIVGGTIGMPPEVMGLLSVAVDKRQGLRKWRRIPRELVKKAGSNLDGRKNGDLIVATGEIEQGSNGSMVNVNGNGNFPVSSALYDYFGLDRPVSATRADSANSEDESSRSSTAASALRMEYEFSSLNGRNSAISLLPDNQQKNGQNGTSKKARGFKIQKENSHSSMGSDYRSSNFVFVQGSNSVASKGRQSGGFLKYDEEYSEDAHHGGKHVNEEVRTAFVKNDAESEEVSQEDVAAENSCEVKEENIGKHEGSVDQDALGESVTGLQSTLEELAGEVQKWKGVGKDDPLIFDDSTRDMLELKDAKISELESFLISERAKSKLEDLSKKIIQAEVEYIVLTTTTISLTEGPLHDLKLSLQPKYISSQEDMRVPKKQPQKLEATEYVKKLQYRVYAFFLPQGCN